MTLDSTFTAMAKEIAFKIDFDAPTGDVIAVIELAFHAVAALQREQDAAVAESFLINDLPDNPYETARDIAAAIRATPETPGQAQ